MKDARKQTKQKNKNKTDKEKEPTTWRMSSLKDLFQLINFKKLEHYSGIVNKLIDPSIDQKELLFYKKGKTLEIVLTHKRWTWIWVNQVTGNRKTGE